MIIKQNMPQERQGGKLRYNKNLLEKRTRVPKEKWLYIIFCYMKN